MVRLNCTSGRSKPAAHLQWFINGEPADSMLTRQYEAVVTGREGKSPQKFLGNIPKYTIFLFFFLFRFAVFVSAPRRLRNDDARVGVSCTTAAFQEGRYEIKSMNNWWLIAGNIVTDINLFTFSCRLPFCLPFEQCLATIASIYWKSNEESVEGDRPLRTPISSPIESRSVPPSSSKADRVQGELKLIELNVHCTIDLIKIYFIFTLNFQLPIVRRRLQLSSSKAY